MSELKTTETSSRTFERLPMTSPTIFSSISDEKQPGELPKIRVFGGKILLNEGISATNFYSIWAFVLYMGIIGITYSTLEPQYLDQVLQIPQKNMGKTTAWLYLVDYSVRLCFALIYGPMIDQYGRKIVLGIGIVLVSLGFFLMPLLDGSLFPGYFTGKCVASAGFIALQMLPFAADYVDDSTKGVMAGMNFGIAFVGGGLGAGVLKLLFFLNLSYREIYWVLSALLFVLGTFASFGLKGGNTYYRNSKSNTMSEITDRAKRWREVKRAFREIPWVPLSIIFGVLGNADFYILTTGLVIWIKSLMTPEDSDPISIAANYQVIFFLLSFVLTGAVALKIDKVAHMKLILPVLVVATLGFIAVPFIDSATSPLMYIFFAIEGMSLPGVFVFSAYLSYRYNPSEIRGTLSGIGNGIGFLGAIVILSVGGLLHDHWRRDASFLLYAGLLVFSLVSVIIIRQKMLKYGDAKPDDVDMKQLNVDLPNMEDQRDNEDDKAV